MQLLWGSDEIGIMYSPLMSYVDKARATSSVFPWYVVPSEKSYRMSDPSGVERQSMRTG